MEPSHIPTGDRPIASPRILLLAALLCAAPALPGGAPRTPPTPPRPVLTTTATVRTPLPAPSPSPAAIPAPARPASVPAQRVAVRAEDVPVDAAPRARAIAGVAHATTVRIGRMDVGAGELVVAAVAPDAYRPLAPQPVADERGVWDRLAEGDLAVMHEHAERLGLVLGTPVTLGGPEGVSVRVGALASNGLPPVADALVSRATGSRLGLDGVARTLLVALEDGAAPADVAHRLGTALGVEALVVPDPRAPDEVTPAAPQGRTVWDVLAGCESSGDWHANTGNGYYGGLQFLPESWWLVGGQGMPHEASREEQIRRAELLLARQGWVAWPVCSIRVGLRSGPAGG